MDEEHKIIKNKIQAIYL